MGDRLMDIPILLTFNKLKTMVRKAQLSDADAEALVSLPKSNYCSQVCTIIGGQLTHRTDHDLDHLHIVTCRCVVLCRICTVQIQLRKNVLDQSMQIIRLPPGNMSQIIQIIQIIQIRNLSALPGRSR